MKTENKSSIEIDTYIAGFPIEVQSEMEKLRKMIQQSAPGATEAISYQMPTFKYFGNLVHFAAYKNHIGFYPSSSGIEHFQSQLQMYETSKGTVKFPHGTPIPLDLVRQIVEFRVKENIERAEARKKKIK